MADGQLTAGAVAGLVGGELVGNHDLAIAGVASLDEAGPGDLTFLASARHGEAFAASRAAAALLPPRFRDLPGGPVTRILVADPRTAMLRVAGRLAPPGRPTWGIHPSVRLGRHTTWTGRIEIAPGAVLGERVRLGRDCRIGSGTVIGDGAVLGDGCHVEAHALVAPGATLGDRTRVKTGARVGMDGFAWVGDGPTRQRVPHQGPCRVGRDVEIGANATVDRGSLGATVIGDGTKIDNLAHVAHNVHIGAHCVIMAQVGIAGTTSIGDDVMIGGQAGLAGQLRVGHRARLAAQSGVIGDVPSGATVSGYPARDHRAVLRQTAALARLAPLLTSLERMTRDHADSD
ncbi:MAG: UDP-3-O-(3-hydroxymyristoyl)glucosamine N-acyltransferase [Gemmatimonadota bacterium]|nr:UDP-3-O-(3-hydroxymyristoyl)glucosamine N-acyltransferase [Gemmatimonadota bacterium]MDH4350434.1 UDP-3-O-(3-hydroxymyristoyl)glucosamine N-acyltransferase [Gemmatimonadota bacterium]MDH5198205.1 UDP-3-O-(3-hydroxymyristoyl)glucosamine N-acyltransferase [Gemmatimonadota bacterium]